MAEEQITHKIQFGVVELLGHFIEVSGIRVITRPVAGLTVNTNKRCWMFYITLLTSEKMEILTYDPIETVLLYEKAITAWLGVKPGDITKLNDHLGEDYFTTM